MRKYMSPKRDIKRDNRDIWPCPPNGTFGGETPPYRGVSPKCPVAHGGGTPSGTGAAP